MIRLRSLLKPNADGEITVTHEGAARTLDLLRERADRLVTLAARVPEPQSEIPLKRRNRHI